MLPFLLCLFGFADSDSLSWPTYKCNAGEYYNPISLTCSALENGYLEDAGVFSCNPSYEFSYTSANTDSSLQSECSECLGDDAVASEFNTECITCPGSKSSESGVCVCADNQILLETDTDGTPLSNPSCETCANGFRPGDFDEFRTPRKCIKCEFDDCLCTYNAGFCFPEGYSFTDSSTFISENIKEFKSKLLRDNLKGVGTLCQTNIASARNNITACQVLTNLCSLTLNDVEQVAFKTSCSWLKEITARQIQETGTLYFRPGWVARVPWQFYDYTGGSRYRDNEEVLQEEISQFYTFQSGTNTSMLDIRVISYGLYGEVYPISTLKNQLSLCSIEPVQLSFGTTMQNTCSFTVADLQSRDTHFHELFLRVGEGLVPIPVHVVGDNEGEGGEVNDWTLTRRYFLTDRHLGVKINEPQNTEEDQFVRYASSIRLSVTVKKWDEGNILVPLLTVTYTDVSVTDSTSNKVEMKFSVTYEQEGDQLSRQLGIAVAVMGALGFLYALIKTIGYRRRNNIIEDCSCQTITAFVVFLCEGLGLLFFWVVAGTSWYYLCIYKGQRAVALFLPADLESYRGILLSCFVLVLVTRLFFLYSSTTYDIFFVDWEKPKGKSIPTNTSTKEEEALTTVSIWRTYFLANEWNELHTLRKICPTLQYMAFLFFTEFIGLKYLATAQPQVYLNPDSVDTVSEYNTLLRVGLITATFFSLWVLQRFYNFLYERFICDQMQMYVDLCSISNISVMILSDVVYGYYIHGRAVHGHADADMGEIVTSLKREEENLCSKRGLEPDSEQQTFDMVIPILLRTSYNRITAPLTTRDISSTRNQRSEADKQIAAYTHINKLFSSFIDRSLDDIDYTIGDKLFLEKLFDMEIREPPLGKGVLYNDAGQSFENILYYGNEWLLFVWEVMLVVILDFATTDFTFAALMAWIINEVVVKKFSEWRCQKNVGDKALIDERFLL